MFQRSTLSVIPQSIVWDHCWICGLAFNLLLLCNLPGLVLCRTRTWQTPQLHCCEQLCAVTIAHLQSHCKSASANKREKVACGYVTPSAVPATFAVSAQK